ncbi:hypothetical protein FRC02_010741 [Tulasnella sp. 418]|nr:hypothetical protein FRC02_010741 [Tulasnella sp. 418]
MSFLGSSSDRPSSFSAIGVDSTLEQWTSEIRKMQSDLDREAEEETKRLMDEIHASRSERKRRASTRPRRSGSLECDDNDAGEENDEIPQSPKDILDIAERQKNQSDALKKLVGEDHSPVKSTHPNVQTSSIPSSPLRYSPVPSTRFIKEAGDLPSPGRSASSANGHKLVGLGISRPVLASANRNGSPTPPEGHSTPSPTGRVKAEKPNRGPLPSRALFSNEDVPRIPLRPTSLQSPLKPSPTIHTQQPSPASSSNPFNGTSGISPSTSPTKGTRRPISDIPSLARSIQPSSSTVHQHFTFKANSDLGPAFIRPSFQRDPTPSLTRLQGRGFVAERVKAGAGFGSTSSTSSNAPASDSPPSSVKTRKSNVLDRWPAAVANTNTEPPPKALPVPKPLPKHTWPVEQPSAPRTNEPTTPTTRTPHITSTPPPEVEHALNNALDVSEMWTSTPSLSQPSSPSVGSSSPAVVTPTNSAFKRRPLPGLTSSENQALGSASPPTSNRRSVIEVAQELKDEDEEPQTRSIHVRTPASSWIKQSSSRRASEDDSEVDAQETGESEVEEQATQVEPQPSRNPLPPYQPPVAIVNPYSAPIPRPQKGINPALEAAKAERRRSNMEKYASIILPPLEEEQTPVPTPDGSLIKRETSGTSSNEGVDEEGRLIPVSSSGSGSGSGAGGSAHRRSPSAFDVHRAMMEHRALIDMEISSPTATDSPLLTAGDLTSETGEAEVDKEDDMIRFSFGDGEVPSVIDVEAILASRNPYVPPPDHQTISVEVLSIVGNTSIPITSNPHIFHDVEVRAIIHRIKSKSSGLVTTRVFGWRGRMAQVGATEARKLGELATRFGSNLIPCIQGSESEEFVRILGGVMVTRQGPRELWSAENTSMHCVRELHGCIFIEQVELERRNLCSAYSYVASIIDTIYVFHGKGSTDVERGEAYLYAQSISSNDGANIVQFEEGSEDLMFSMSLGDDDYASADFWRFRKNVLDTSTWLYKVDTGDNPKVQWIQEVAAESIVPTGVYIVQAPMELYVVVGGEARSLRKDILHAMHAALAISHYLAPSLPFEPPVHALVLPSKVPIELRIAHFRYMDEEQLNVGETPEHMNLLSSQEALTQLSTTSWPRAALDDYDLLPLGIAPADVATLTASL